MRVKAEVGGCGCKMKRVYTRAVGGDGWDPVGWMCSCGCGCIGIDNGDWSLQDCTGCIGGSNEE